MKPSDGVTTQEFIASQRKTLNSCMHPFSSCKKRPIRSHSIQNSRVLDLLHEKGKVVMIRNRFNPEPTLNFGMIGRNEASIFTGLCAEHDAEIFRPIDTAPFDINNPEHLFLVAYRSVLKEVHTASEAAVRAQTLFKSAVEKGLAVPDMPDPGFIHATGAMISAYSLYKYKVELFEQALLSRSFDAVAYDNFIIHTDAPVLAVSSLYSESSPASNNYFGVILNVFPINNHESVLSLCYARTHADKARMTLGAIINSEGELQKYQLSRLIIANVENFVLSPRQFAIWSVEKISKIENAFRSSMQKQLDIGEDIDFMMF